MNIRILAEAAQAAFVWQEHMGKIIGTALLSMVPTYEGLYALVTGAAMGLPAGFAYLIAFVCSSIPVPFILLLLRPVLDWMYTWPIGFVRKFAAWVDARAERKSKEVDKKGMLGLFLFVAVPLPGTGVWTGSAIATLLKMNKKQAALAIFLGNVAACLIMTVLAYLGVRIAG